MDYTKLPIDIIKHIITYDKHFIVRKNKLVSIIPKDDYRYNLLHYICLSLSNNFINISDNEYCYHYIFPNICNNNERTINYIDNDMFQVRIYFTKNNIIKYYCYIGRLLPKNDNKIKKISIYHKNELSNYEWRYIIYEYERK
jgi:hypothetical protein